MASLIKADKLDPQSGTALEIGTSGDTVTVPTGAGLTVTDEVKTNKVSPATGTAFALGDSGDTFTVPSGATIVNSGTATGFGAALTGSTNNTVTTVTAANAISGEANLKFDGTDLTVETGNVVIGTAGKGIDFSAQTPTSATGATTTGELLDHYEEGTWTPNVGGDASYHSQDGKYTRIGRMVLMETTFQVATIGTGSDTTMSGLPFSCRFAGSLSRYGNGGVSVVMLNPNPSTGTTLTFNGMTAAATTITDNLQIFISGTQVCVSLIGQI